MDVPDTWFSMDNEIIALVWKKFEQLFARHFGSMSSEGSSDETARVTMHFRAVEPIDTYDTLMRSDLNSIPLVRESNAPKMLGEWALHSEQIFESIVNPSTMPVRQMTKSIFAWKPLYAADLDTNFVAQCMRRMWNACEASGEAESLLPTMRSIVLEWSVRAPCLHSSGYTCKPRWHE